ncbi:SagB/ThcOx family dehydrogenase [Candidatus Babeliales bacterium]|nr:SagB/ThcOx family dehydrogenase [Candidatus Babeliales bacterium]
MIYKPIKIALLLGTIAALTHTSNIAQHVKTPKSLTQQKATKTIKLPIPNKTGNYSLEKALATRRSIRNYKQKLMTLAQLSQLLWSAQGSTGSDNLRSAPSAGALYPLEIYAAVSNISGLEIGIYKYNSQKNMLTLIIDDNQQDKIFQAGNQQSALKQPAATLILTGTYARTQKKYGTRSTRYVHMEAGHASQNIYLQATAMNLGTVAIGAFSDTAIKNLMGLPIGEQPLYLMPIGFV